MKPRSRAVRLADEAVSEVLGYVLMLFLSSAVLMVSLQAFLMSRDTTADLQQGRELRVIVERLAQEVQQAGFVASEMPEASYVTQLRLPELGGRAYYVNLSGNKVYANTTDGELQAEGEAEVASIGTMVVQGSVYGAQGVARVRYEKHPDSDARWINLTV